MKLEKLEKEITNLLQKVRGMVDNYNPESNKYMYVEREIDKIYDDISNKMMEYHLLIDNWNETDIDDNFGVVMSITNVRKMINSDMFSDDDGVFFYVTDKNKETDIQVMVEWIATKQNRKDFDFVIWYKNSELEVVPKYSTFNFMDIEEDF